MGRHYGDWIEGFIEYSDKFPSPVIFRKWAALSAISACLQRRCYTKIVGRQQFANLYILLVAPPGVGKSISIKAARELCSQQAGSLKIAPSRITAAAFFDEIGEARFESMSLMNGGVLIHHSLSAFVDEFGVFVRKGDLDFMSDLADIFDCPDPFEYKTKTSGVVHAEASWFNMISGCTPRTVKDTFNDDALEMGFPARMIMVHSKSPIVHQSLFHTGEANLFTTDNPNFQRLSGDMEKLLLMTGEFRWSKDAMEFLEAWYKDKMAPFPTNPRLSHYCTRRLTHISKLAMVYSAARSDDMCISLGHIMSAKATLLEAEDTMNEAIAQLGTNQFKEIQNGIRRWLNNAWKETRKPVPEYILIRALEQECPPHLVDAIIKGLVDARHLEAMPKDGKIGKRHFIPDQETRATIDRGDALKKRAKEDRADAKRSSS